MLRAVLQYEMWQTLSEVAGLIKLLQDHITSTPCAEGHKIIQNNIKELQGS